MSVKKIALTGIRASGNLHIGNYLGALKPALELQSSYRCMYFIADMHSLTTNRDRDAMREHTYDIVAAWLAAGLDPQAHCIYRQSDISIVAELAWYLSCVTGMGLLEKAHAYKDAQSQAKELNHGVFAYPVLMAADILLYDADVVPVGKDQKQHVEMARDIAGSFNALFGEGALRLPQPLIREEVMTIPGLDGRKMSKSYGNEIPLTIDEKGLRKKVMSIKTDSTPLEEPKSMQGTLVGDLFKLFGSASQYQDLEQRLQRGGLGWGHAKEELATVLNSALSPLRERYDELRGDLTLLDRILDTGQEQAFAMAQGVLNRVRERVGFRPIRMKIG